MPTGIRARSQAAKVSKHTGEMLAYVVKSNRDTRSRQIKDPFVTLYAQGGAIDPPIPPERLVQLSEDNAIHSACMKAKADDAVGRGWKLEASSEDSPDPEEYAKRIGELLESLTPELTFSELLHQAAYELQVVGWSAWEIVRDPDDLTKLGAIYPVPSHTVRATKDPRKWVQIRAEKTRYFKTFGCQDFDLDADSGKEYDYGTYDNADRIASEILIFKTYSARTPYYGVPNWISGIPAIAELTAIREFNVSFFSSGGMADRIIHVKGGGTDQAKWMSSSLKNQLEESKGQGHVTLYTSGGPDSDVKVEWLSPTATRREGQFIHRREDLVKEVLIAHNVPPFRIGWAVIGSLGGSAAREMLHSYRIGSIQPIQTMLENRLNQWLFGPFGINLEGYKWVLEALDWDETDLDLNISTKCVQFGVYTPNEAREVMGQDRIEDPAMDRVYMGGNPITAAPDANNAMDVVQGFKTALDQAVSPVAPTPGAPPAPMPPPNVPVPAAAPDAGVGQAALAVKLPAIAVPSVGDKVPPDKMPGANGTTFGPSR